MDLAHVFTNENVWIEKVLNIGHTMDTLCSLIKEMSDIYEIVDPSDIEDFIYRLKVCNDKKKGSKVDMENDMKIPTRVCVYVGKMPFFFKACPQEKCSKKSEMNFYCEECGPGTKVKVKRLKPHASIHKH
ncbi:hypothetical protein SteCoe_7168 [Stentor coeruleus]|uniref:Uncharacterized protein n=1 Tax=Stentor coeruleus TaxID=5963 RepID=A0A1R2CNC3_9CILI|nr:hypothetical protein SteCoe_7168 [Stentor coeruleus]